MLGGKDDGAHTSLLGKQGNFICIEGGRIEITSLSSIPVRENSCERLYLFTISLTHRLSIIDSAEMGIQSEMYEHRIFVRKPLIIAGCSRNAKQESRQQGYIFLHRNRI